MDTARTARAARVRRILVRAGVVLGGAVAGTAAAWLMSMGTASAETSTPQVIQPVVDTLTAPGETKPGTTPQFVEHMVDTLLPEAPTPPKELDDFTKHMQGAVDRVGKELAGHLSVPVNHGATGTTPVKTRMLTAGEHENVPAGQAVDVPVQQSTPVTVNRERTAANDTGRHQVTESSRRAPPTDGPLSPALPALPPLPAPLAPPTGPSGACSSCSGHGSDDDMGVPVAHTWPVTNTGSATSRALRLITQHVATAVSAQPGVTPD